MNNFQNFNPYQHAANPVVAIVNTFNQKRLEAGMSTYAYEVALKDDNIKRHDAALIEFLESLGMISTAPFNLSCNDFQVFEHKDKENIDRLVIAKDLFVDGQNRLFVVYGSLKSNEEFQKQIEAVIPKSTMINVKIVSSDKEGRISTDIKTIDSSKINKVYPEFYPFPGFYNLIHSPLDFINSKQNLAIFIGPPGTGKTSLLRNIISSIHEEFDDIYICSSPTAYQQPDFFSSISRGDKRKLIILEDAATAIAKREEGNVACHELLNQLDGIVSSEDKIIISTNLSTLKSVDEAIYRPGRCYGVFQTKLLTPEQANVARTLIDKEPVEIIKDVTLAAALNWESASNVDHLKGSVSFTN